MGNYFGGIDLQDTPYSAINAALNENWRSDARKVIVIFSNTWGYDTEPGSGITLKEITAKARAKHVEILPIFTSRTFRSDAAYVNYIPQANAYYTALAKGAKGHMTEVSGSIDERLVYDVIKGHIYSPDVVISAGQPTKNPKTNKTNSDTTTDKKITVKTKKKTVLSAAKSSSPKSTIVQYAWDMNGDGVTDYQSDQPYVEHQYDDPYDGTVCVTATDGNGNSSTGCQDVAASDDDSDVTDQPGAVLDTPDFSVVRDGFDVKVTWTPVEGTVLIKDSEAGILTSVDGMLGTVVLHDCPDSAFELIAQLVRGADMSDDVVLHVPAVTGSHESGSGESQGSGGTDVSGGLSGEQEGGSGDDAGIVSGVLGASDQSAALLLLPVNQSVKNGAPANMSTVGETKESADELARAGEQGYADKMQLLAGELSGVIEDYLSWLLLVIVLLLVLYAVQRKRDRNAYRHNRQRKYGVPKRAFYAA